MTELTFWFDVHSPWAYLASFRIGDLARKHGLRLRWRPLHLPRLLDEIGGHKPLEASPQRVAWFRQDIADHAELLGVPLRTHPNYPLRNSRALRACILAEDEGKAEGFVRRVLKGYWAEEADITDLEQLARWGAETGLDGDAVKAAAMSDAFKERLDANTSEAIARGVFGVPTIDTGARLYFGNDRLDLLDSHIAQGKIPLA
ncbi:MAG: 2-hydroxychromene-2-carboxylate isomerase [Alphaproteobacteria bacterium]|uniref:2-hydroxychromene-2-carboxylate isomerase n=1 Tax=Aestuariivirga sp. TaxID=2650926 RepID=UPI003016DE6D|nr:2-hydroxychromene-2-carboxylate isomerase [Alphaproteobacteria bacterium]